MAYYIANEKLHINHSGGVSLFYNAVSFEKS